jgi:C-terminal processing protease CtpA/Prc
MHCASCCLQVETIGKAVPAFENGVRVPEFTVGSVAQKAGFQPNDIILKVGT